MTESMIEPRELVLRHLMKMVRPEALEAYEVLASLSYPIPDQATFLSQIEDAVKSHPVVANLLSVALPATAFPIETTQSAFEKLDELGPTLPSGIDDPLPPAPDTDAGADPDFREGFGEACGTLANRVYEHCMSRYVRPTIAQQITCHLSAREVAQNCVRPVNVPLPRGARPANPVPWPFRWPPR